MKHILAYVSYTNTKRNKMKHIIEHYRNGRNLGDDWWFITKMMLQGNLLTNDRYKLYIDQLFVDAAIDAGEQQ